MEIEKMPMNQPSLPEHPVPERENNLETREAEEIEVLLSTINILFKLDEEKAKKYAILSDCVSILNKLALAGYDVSELKGEVVKIREVVRRDDDSHLQVGLDQIMAIAEKVKVFWEELGKKDVCN